jgi:hypothetical protein
MPLVRWPSDKQNTIDRRAARFSFVLQDKIKHNFAT